MGREGKDVEVKKRKKAKRGKRKNNEMEQGWNKTASFSHIYL